MGGARDAEMVSQNDGRRSDDDDDDDEDEEERKMQYI